MFGMAEPVHVREIDDEEGRRLLRIVRRGTGSVVTWRRAQMVLLSAQGMAVAKIDAFRTRKGTIKVSYTAAEAETHISEAVTGISEEMGDVCMAMQRAQDKAEQLRARAGALDELMATDALEDATSPVAHDDLQSQLDTITAGACACPALHTSPPHKGIRRCVNPLRIPLTIHSKNHKRNRTEYPPCSRRTPSPEPSTQARRSSRSETRSTRFRAAGPIRRPPAARIR